LYLFEGLGIIWLWIAGFYLVAGILDLVMYMLKEKAKVRAANKKAAKTAQEAEAAKNKMKETKQEEKV
jgi:hypothetical protein